MSSTTECSNTTATEDRYRRNSQANICATLPSIPGIVIALQDVNEAESWNVNTSVKSDISFSLALSQPGYGERAIQRTTEEFTSKEANTSLTGRVSALESRMNEMERQHLELREEMKRMQLEVRGEIERRPLELSSEMERECVEKGIDHLQGQL